MSALVEALMFRRLAAAGLAALLIATPASAQSTPPAPLAPSPAAAARGEGRLTAMRERLDAATASGAISRAQSDIAAATLRLVAARDDELARRDHGLDAADRQFLSDWLDQIAAYYPFLAEPGAPAARIAAPAPLEAALPGALVCPSRTPVLLAVGRDRATASVQRSMDVDVTLIAEAAASPYAGSDTLSLRVRGPGLDTTIAGARAGTLLYAGATSNFALKAGHTARLTADAMASPGAAGWVRIWGVCRVS